MHHLTQSRETSRDLLRLHYLPLGRGGRGAAGGGYLSFLLLFLPLLFLLIRVHPR